MVMAPVIYLATTIFVEDTHRMIPPVCVDDPHSILASHESES
jgi:hypothetical protein